MTKADPVLHLFCGKIASGKTSLARALADAPSSVLISEDQMLADLYPGEIADLETYRRSTVRLRKALAPHIVRLLQEGMSVVLDFQANTPAARTWAMDLAKASGARHQLHWLRATDAVCKARLAHRNASGTHEYQVSEAEFDLFTSHFVEPDESEGLTLVIHDQA